MIEKVISGGQVGVDQAGLYAAADLGIPTGGWAPKGYKTSDGNNPNLLLNYFNLQEHESENYPPRTAMNVKESDGTLIIAKNINSPGTKLTIKFCKYQYKKPYFIIDLSNKIDIFDEVLHIINWIKSNNIKILNIAGNRDNYSGTFSYRILYTLFLKMPKI